MATYARPQRPNSSNHSHMSPRGKSALHTTQTTTISQFDENGNSIILNGDEGAEVGARFAIREYPSPANFFSLDIFITSTGQTWCIFVPIDPTVEHLLYAWDSNPRYDQRKMLGEWIVKYANLEFQGDTVIGSTFDNKLFSKACEMELRRIFHVMVIRIQSVVRGFLARLALRRRGPPPIEYDRSFYTTAAIAKMRPKIVLVKSSQGQRGSTIDDDLEDFKHQHPTASPPSSSRAHSSRGGRSRSPTRHISTAPVSQRGDGGGDNLYGGSTERVLHDHDWLDAPRSVTAGDSPRLARPKKQSPRKGHFQDSRPSGTAPYWPSKNNKKSSPRGGGRTSPRGATAGHNKRGRSTQKSAKNQQKIQDVMALYITAPRGMPKHHYPETSIYSHIDQMYDELQSMHVSDEDDDGTQFPHLGPAANVSMEYVNLFDSRIDTANGRSRMGSRADDGGVHTFGTLRHMDSIEDKSTATEKVFHSPSQSLEGVDPTDDGGGSRERGGVGAEDSVSVAPQDAAYLFRESEVMESNEPSLWNASVTDNIFLPNEGSLANATMLTVPEGSRLSPTGAAFSDPNYLRPGDYKLLVDYRDAKQRKAWLCILRALTLFSHRFQDRKLRKRLLRDMQGVTEDGDIRAALQLSVAMGDIELALKAIKRIQTIIQSHAKGHSVIASSFNPTSLSNLSLIVDVAHAFLSLSEISGIVVDVLLKLSAISNIGDLPEVIGASGVLRLVMSMWARYSQKNSVDEARTILLMKISGKLASESSKNRLRLYSVANSNILSKLLFKYMKTNREMFERFMRMICKACTKDKSIMDYMCRSDLYGTLIRGITELGSEKPLLVLICKSITILCSAGHMPTQTFFGSTHLCLLYIEMLENQKSDVTVYRYVVSMIISVCAKHHQNMANLAECELPQFLMNTLSDDSLDGEVLRCSISLLFHLSSHDPLKESLLAMGLDSLLRDMGMRYDIKRTVGVLSRGQGNSPGTSPEKPAPVAKPVDNSDRSASEPPPLTEAEVSNETTTDASKPVGGRERRVTKRPVAGKAGGPRGRVTTIKPNISRGGKNSKKSSAANSETKSSETDSKNSKSEECNRSGTESTNVDKANADDSESNDTPEDVPNVPVAEEATPKLDEKQIANAASAAVGSIMRTASNSHIADLLASMEEEDAEKKKLVMDSASIAVGTILRTASNSHIDEMCNGTQKSGNAVSSQGDKDNSSADDPSLTVLDRLKDCVDAKDEKMASSALHDLYNVLQKFLDDRPDSVSTSVVKEVLDSPVLLLRLLNTFMKSGDVQNSGLWILRHLPYEDNYEAVERLCESGVCDILYCLIQEHIYNDEVFVQAVDVLAFMASRHEGFRVAAGSMGYCKILMAAMSRIVVSNSRLMTACCMYTRVLAREHVENLCHSGVAGQVIKFLIANKTEPEIIHICGETILALTEVNSVTAMTCLASHKHIRLYGHILKVNNQSSQIANVVSNVLAALSRHQDGSTIASEVEKSGIVIDLVNALRAGEPLENGTPVEVLRTSLLTVVHLLCHVTTMEPMFKTANGEEVLKSLLQYKNHDLNLADSVRDIARVGLEFVQTPPASIDTPLQGRPGVAVEDVLGGGKRILYSYAAVFDKHVSAIDKVQYTVDHGPYPDQPVIKVSPSEPLGKENTAEQETLNFVDIENGLFTGDGDIGNPPKRSADPHPPQAEQAPPDDTSVQIEASEDKTSVVEECVELTEQINSKDTGVHTAEGKNGLLDALPAEEACISSPSEDAANSSPKPVSDGKEEEKPSSREPSPVRPRIKKTLSGNSLLRMMQTATDASFIIENLRRSATTRDRVLGVNTLNRTLQLLTEYTKDGSISENPLAATLIEDHRIVLDIVDVLTVDQNIQLVAASVLSKLPASATYTERYIEEGLFTTIYSLLQQHTHNGDAFAAWAKYAAKVVKQNNSNRLNAGKNHGCQVVNKLLHEVLTESKQVLALLGFIAAMCIGCTKNQGHFARTGIGSTIVKYLIENKKDAEAVRKCVKVIDCLCAGNIELNLKVLASQRHLRLYIHIIKSNASNTVAVQTLCGLLMTISNGNSEFVNAEIELGQDKLIEDMVALLHDAATGSKYDDARVQAILAVLSHWAHNIRVLKNALVQSGGFLDTLKMYNVTKWNSVTMQIVSGFIQYFESFR